MFSFKLFDILFLSYRVHRQTDTQTDNWTPAQTDKTYRHTDRLTDGHEYSIFVVDKPNYNYRKKQVRAFFVCAKTGVSPLPYPHCF